MQFLGGSVLWQISLRQRHGTLGLQQAHCHVHPSLLECCRLRANGWRPRNSLREKLGGLKPGSGLLGIEKQTISPEELPLALITHVFIFVSLTLDIVFLLNTKTKLYTFQQLPAARFAWFEQIAFTESLSPLQTPGFQLWHPSLPDSLLFAPKKNPHMPDIRIKITDIHFQ